jgi:hypothetical protein
MQGFSESPRYKILPLPIFFVANFHILANWKFWKVSPFSYSYYVENVLVNGQLHTDWDLSLGRLTINNLELSLNDDWLILINA